MAGRTPGILTAMTRILLRMPKGPFEIASPERALSRDLIGYNTGNLIFLEAAYKLLDTRDAVITPDWLRGADDRSEADQ